MSADFIMLKFDTPYGAQQAMAGVRALTDLNYAWIDDVAVVERHNSGRVVTHTTHGSISSGALFGGLIGMLLGWFFPPLLFLAWFGLGAGAGALIEKASKESGLPAGLLEKVRDELTKGSSALLLLGAKGDADQMARAFEQYHPTSIVREELSTETVESLKAKLVEAESTAQSETTDAAS
jgi:uncharacterized membrane protein